MLPGAFALAGTAIGSMIAPGMGSWAGGLVGAGVGQFAQGVAGAGDERAQATREAAEQLTAALGESTSRVREFSDVITATGAAVKVYQQAQEIAAGVGLLTPGTPAGLGAVVNALGEYAPQDLTLAAKYSQQPGMAGIGARLASGAYDGSDASAEMMTAALQGNFKDVAEFGRMAQDLQLKSSPDYQQDMGWVNKASDWRSWVPFADGPPTSAGGWAENLIPIAKIAGTAINWVNGTMDAKDIKDNLPGDPLAKYAAGITQSARAISDSGALDDAMIQNARGATGFHALRGTAADAHAAQDALRGDLSLAATNTESAIALDQGVIDNPQVPAAMKASAQNDLLGKEALDWQYQTQIQGSRREELFRGIGEMEASTAYNRDWERFSGRSARDMQRITRTETAALSGVLALSGSDLTATERYKMQTGILQEAYQAQEDVFSEDADRYGLTRAQGQNRLTRGLLSGRRYDEMAGDEYGILSAETARANQLRRSAASPGVPYAERLRMQTEAAGMETGADQQRYQFKMAGFGQNLAENSLSIDKANLAVTRAATGGAGPEGVLQAQQGALSSYADRIKELSSELARGGLTVDDRIAKERQLTQVQGEALTLARDAVRARDSGLTAIAGSEMETGEVGLSRRMRAQGNAAVTGEMLAASQSEIAALQRQQADEKDPERKAALGTQVAKAQEHYQGVLDVGDTYQRTGALTRQIEGDRTAFEVSQISPYREGPNSNPLVWNNTLIADYGKDLAAIEKSKRDTIASGRPWRDEDETSYEEQKNADRLQIAHLEHNRAYEMEKDLPLLLAGGGGIHGVGAGAVSFDALSSYFSPSVLHGSWGHPANVPGTALPGSLPGNEYEAFQRSHVAAGAPHEAGAAAGSQSPNSIVSAIQQAAHAQGGPQMVSLLHQAVQLLQRIEAGGRQRLPAQNGPSSSSAGAVKRELSNSFNPNRPRLL